ncbi:hypothetical protein [Acinetobacter gerneri]|uniref:Uncharacterized protein n=2 Tax=Acinetobacter gerneri TaxID=202952 RepID=N8ZS26_9GAMM|nr:hypothetical protein [Acinetobacter gerneri]ENV34538.1 hypothetical protein F960_01276 [Acinetobacter gerneri DSM 14967 = CIP 107464 = MTCC 9824]
MDHKDFFYQGISINLDCSNPPKEVVIRNAIGRMYYYIYHEALVFIQNNDFLSSIFNDELFKNKNPSSHMRLVNTFSEYARISQDLKYGSISRYIGSLHSLRCLSDYNLTKVVKENDFFSFLANLESLKLEIAKINSDFFRVDTKLKSESITQSTTNIGQIVVKKKPSLRILE